MRIHLMLLQLLLVADRNSSRLPQPLQLRQLPVPKLLRLPVLTQHCDNLFGRLYTPQCCFHMGTRRARRALAVLRTTATALLLPALTHGHPFCQTEPPTSCIACCIPMPTVVSVCAPVIEGTQLLLVINLELLLAPRGGVRNVELHGCCCRCCIQITVQTGAIESSVTSRSKDKRQQTQQAMSEASQNAPAAATKGWICGCAPSSWCWLLDDGLVRDVSVRCEATAAALPVTTQLLL